jgi:heme-degrading monooxygenase HmoA
MITEFAEIEVKPGMEQKFRDGVEAAKPVFARAPGCHGVELHHSIEHPQKFMLLVKWESVAHHTEMFQKSPDFQIWRGHVGDCFAARPTVWHSETVVSG